jgi:hypothetical protein
VTEIVSFAPATLKSLGVPHAVAEKLPENGVGAVSLCAAPGMNRTSATLTIVRTSAPRRLFMVPPYPQSSMTAAAYPHPERV